jgi:hypothetical protein
MLADYATFFSTGQANPILALIALRLAQDFEIRLGGR